MKSKSKVKTQKSKVKAAGLLLLPFDFCVLTFDLSFFESERAKC
jgi:hypothetical protein